MVYTANVLSVMIASPSDVTEQRDDVRSIVDSWNFIHAFSRSLILMPVGWETHAAPDLASKAQDIINKRVLENCDILVGIFWTRIGTPTAGFDSGTVEEISRHIDAGKPAMVYFSDAPVAPQTLDAQQYAGVQKFKSWCRDRGLVESFTSAAEFREKFRSQLDIQLNSNPYLRGVLTNVSVSSEIEQVVELSADAKNLLLAATDDHDGYVMTLSTLGGRHIQTNRKSFGNVGDARSSARWEAALDELIALSYLVGRDQKGEVYQVTHAGYRRADAIQGQVHDR